MLEDPLGIDRRLADIAQKRASFRRALRRGGGADHAFEFAARFVSVRLLGELRDALEVDPFAPALLRWAAFLHVERTLVELDVAHAHALRGATHRLDRPERGELTLSDMLARALADRRGLREAWLEAFWERGSHAAELALRRAERRAEAETELGDRGFESRADTRERAARAVAPLLDATEAAHTELGVQSLSSFIELALGLDSQAAWPSRLGARSLADLFDETPWFRELSFELDTLPAPLGAASYLRALERLGAALRPALVSRSLPFAQAHEPFGLERAVWGSLFVLVPFGESFARRKLGVGRSAFAAHRRTLSRVLLFGVRELALDAELATLASEGAAGYRRGYAERVHRALGFELPAQAAGLSFAPKPAAAERLLGLLLACALEQRLTETHDEDWYRNPRAAEELREMGRAAPALVAASEDVDAGCALLVRKLAAAVS